MHKTKHAGLDKIGVWYLLWVSSRKLVKMSEERTLSVSVATFINPTIFWVIDICRISSRDELEKELLECSSESADPVVGEVRVTIRVANSGMCDAN